MSDKTLQSAAATGRDMTGSNTTESSRGDTQEKSARAIAHTCDAGNVPPCPRCNAPMEPVLRDDVILFYGCSRYREDGCRGRWSFERDANGDSTDRLVLLSCPECHQGLRKGYGRNGRPYCACFEAAKHKGGQTIFFDEEGRPGGGNWKKTRFTCPECGAPLVHFVVQSGARRGKKTFACFASAQHTPKTPHYWEDLNGEPAW